MLAALKNKKVLYILIGYLPLSISLVFTPIYTHYISVKDFGFLNLFNTLIGLVAPILHLGIKDGFGFWYWKNDQFSSPEELFKRTFGSLFVLQMAMLTLFFFFGKAILQFYFEPLREEAYAHFFYILIFYAAFLNMNDLLFYYYRNRDQLKEFIGLNLASTVLMTVGSFVGIVALNKGIYGAIYGRAAGYIPVVLFFALRNIKNIKVEFAFSKNIIMAGMPILLSAVIGTYAATMDKYFLQKYLDLSLMGIYGIALTIIYVIDVLLISIFNFLLPETLKGIQANLPHDTIYKPILEIFVVFVLFIALVMCSAPLVMKLFPPAYSEALKYLPFMAVAPILKFWYSFNSLNYYLFKKSLVFLKLQSITFVLTIGVMYLVPVQMGIYSAVIIFISNAVIQLVVSYVFLVKERYFMIKDPKLVLLSMLIAVVLLTFGWLYSNSQRFIYFELMGLTIVVTVFVMKYKLITDLASRWTSNLKAK
jgi:O-antigen/teichoic acid export membrane protein